MKILKDQVLISTNLDSHGEKLTTEQLIQLFYSTPDEFPIGQHHDQSLPAIGLGRNKRLKQISPTEYAIVADIEIFDEESFNFNGGFSASFKTYTFAPKMADNSSCSIKMKVNPRNFSFDYFVDFVDLSTENCIIHVEELKQKADVSYKILFISFVTAEIASGFFKAIGANIYQKIKDRIADYFQDKELEAKKAPRIQFTFPLKTEKNSIEVIFETDTTTLKDFFDTQIEIGLAEEFVLNAIKKIPDTKVKSIFLERIEIEPFWRIVWIQDLWGNKVE